MMKFVDTHTHLFASEFDEDRDAVMTRCLEQGVDTLILPAIDSETHAAMLACCQQWSCCNAALGLHPTSVGANYKEELSVVQSLMATNDFVAVGEIGLDLYWSKEFLTEQEEALHVQIEWALQKGKPVILHTRDAFPEMERALKRYEGRGLRAVFHGYSGDVDQYRRLEAMDCTFYYGIGGVVTFKKASLAEVVSEMSLSKIVLETDAPYLTPVPYRGKRNESGYIPLIAARIAEIKGVSLEEVAAATTKNANFLFNL